MTQASASVLRGAATRKARYALADLVPELDRASEVLRRAGKKASSRELDQMHRRVAVILRQLSE